MSNVATPDATARLSLWQAAYVVARRDFLAILLSRSFLLFLLGPLFPLLVGGLAGGIGSEVRGAIEQPQLGVAMSGADTDKLFAAEDRLGRTLPGTLPALVRVDTDDGAPETWLADPDRNLGAVLTGTLESPRLTGSEENIQRWEGPVSLLTGEARRGQAITYPSVELSPTQATTVDRTRQRLLTAQSAQVLLFLLSMLLAGMVLSNLVEEKANKIIEILAAAIPMDAVFLGKLFAMLGVSFVGIAVWGAVGGTIAFLGREALPALPDPALGWPLFVALGVAYFAMNYLLLGSVFLAIGSLAATVREVQTLSLPVTMSQLLVFFAASFAIAQPGSAVELAAIAFPLTSPYALLARAAQDETVWIHLAGLAWQALFVAIFIRAGAALFRRRVMQSGPQKAKRSWLQRLRKAPQG